MELRNVVLVDAARSAFGRGGRGKLVATRLDEAGAQVLRALLDRQPKVTDAMIEDVGVGNVAGGASEFAYLGNIQRLAGLPLEACSFHSNRQCGSSMETLHRIAMGIMVGTIDCGVAMGVERMGRGLGIADGDRPTQAAGATGDDGDTVGDVEEGANEVGGDSQPIVVLLVHHASCSCGSSHRLGADGPRPRVGDAPRARS